MAELPAKRSTAVTVLAVVNFILGGLRLALSVLLLQMGIAMLNVPEPSAAPQPPGQTTHNPEDYGPDIAGILNGLGAGALHLLHAVVFVLGVVLVVVAVVFLLFSVLLFVAGVGLLRRRPGGRWLALVLGGLGGMLAVLYLTPLILTGGPATSEGLVISLLGFLVHGGYCIITFTVLLNARIAVEFAGVIQHQSP